MQIPTLGKANMREILKRICELQPFYSSENTPEMQERGALINKSLKNSIKSLEKQISPALEAFGNDFFVSSSDGIGRKTEAPWVRFCSKRMSPTPRDGYYAVIHFKRDGSGLYFTLGCGSTTWKDGSLIRLQPKQIFSKTSAALEALQSEYGKIETFIDTIDLGANRPLPKSFEQATALAKFIAYDEIDTSNLEDLLFELAKLLKTIYENVQSTGADLTQADQAQIEIEKVINPRRAKGSSQGYGLSSAEKKAVETRAMELTNKWLLENGYKTQDMSAKEPYDFLATKDGKELLVEVKGTTSNDPTSILMTANEVKLHQSQRGTTALAIVSSIKLKKGTVPIADGGILAMDIGWNIDDWISEPTAYRLEKRHFTELE